MRSYLSTHDVHGYPVTGSLFVFRVNLTPFFSLGRRPAFSILKRQSHKSGMGQPDELISF
jgi:hypothetical protein